MSACDRPVSKALRTALVSSVALAMLAGLAISADAAPRRSKHAARVSPSAAANKSNPERDGFTDVPKGGVLQIGVSVGNQRVTLFRDGKRVVQGPVSSGTASHPTPMGVFSVIEKDRHHRSNIYSNAPMPFMQRITWSGVAMHEGMLPGYPASHGCIRLPRDLAARLWPTTKLGVRVIVSRHEIAPVDFDHPSLFSPKPKPSEPPVAAIDSVDGMKPGLRVQVAEASTTLKDVTGVEVFPRSAVEPAKPTAPEASDDRKPAEGATVVETKPIDDGRAADKPPAQAVAAEIDADAVKATGTVTPVPPRDVSPTELRKAVDIPVVTEPSPAVVPAPAEPKAAEAAPPGEDAVKPAPTGADASKRSAPPRYKSAEQPVKRNGQVAVFVSRKEKKIFVRQGTVPLFEMPIVIENIERPLGTHVFTAMGPRDNGGGMRWNLITVTDPTKSEQREPRRKTGKEAKPAAIEPAPSTNAKEALDRIRMPKEAVDRIGELLIPGSSLVVSNQGISHETGRGTEFIILTR